GYYEKKIAEGMTGTTALRALKRKISDTLYQHMIDDARRLAAKDPGGHTGYDSASSAAGSHPETPALRKSHSRATANSKTGTGQRPLRLRPAPDRRRTSRRAAGVQVEPRPGPHRGRRQDRPNGQMSRSPLRTDRVIQPCVKIAGPAHSWVTAFPAPGP